MNLAEKLRMITSKPKPAPEAAPSFTDCWQRTRVRPLDEFPELSSLNSKNLMLMQHEDLPSPFLPGKILFLDTETTGLSGGAGTVAFEIGAGVLTKDGFAVTQYVMRDYPEERYMLEKVLERLDECDVICTFNGKSFDIPLLRTRFILNRLPTDVLDKPHLDLLHMARRLYKLRLKQCRLSRLEEEVLGIPRVGDLPGNEAPARFHQYLLTHDFALLDDVLFHNEQDVASMLALLSHMCADYESPERIGHQEDIFSMAGALDREKHVRQSRRCYRLVPSGRLHAVSQMRLADSHRKSGEKEKARDIYLDMIIRHEGGAEPYIALAKYYEHTEHDLEKALEFTRKGLLTLAEPTLLDPPSVQETRNQLQYRYDRLQGRLTRKGQ